MFDFPSQTRFLFLQAIDGQLYVRISAHIYNEMSQFQALGKLLLEYPSNIQEQLSVPTAGSF